MARFEVQWGGIYAPGWHVYEKISERHYRSQGTFEDKADAQEWCDVLNLEAREMTRDELIEAIYKMVGDQTWNVAPVNYTVAERATTMVEQFYGIETVKGMEE
jgi:hypothetical protein